MSQSWVVHLSRANQPTVSKHQETVTNNHFRQMGGTHQNLSEPDGVSPVLLPCNETSDETDTHLYNQWQICQGDWMLLTKPWPQPVSENHKIQICVAPIRLCTVNNEDNSQPAHGLYRCTRTPCIAATQESAESQYI